MTLMENDEATDPLQVRLFSPVGKMARAHLSRHSSNPDVPPCRLSPRVLCDILPPESNESKRGL
jgi:hypothetical protein